MKTVKSPKLLLLAGLLSLALAGCGNSSSVKTAPATEELFYTYTMVFGNHSTLWGSGYNGYGQLGNGSLDTTSTFRPVSRLGMPVLGYASGANHVVAFANNSTLWTWGSNLRGRLGLGTLLPITGTSAFSTYPQLVPGIKNRVVSVAAGWLHTVAVAGPNRSVLAWGANNYGQLGNNGGSNNYQDYPYPTPVLGPNGAGVLDNVDQVAAGGSHTLALRGDGTVWAWGDNAFGQAGIAAPNPVPFPVQVTGFPAGRVVKVAAAGSYSLALMEDGTVWSWGYNGYGQLGTGAGNTAVNPKPAQVVDAFGAPIHAVDISAGLMHGLALVDPGNGGRNEIWSWGFNERGQLGIGEKTAPIAHAAKASALDALVGSSAASVGIYAFGNDSFVRINGQWYGVGDNGSGELGQSVSNNTLAYKVLPVALAVP